jgi:hypothetical protein
MTYREFWLVYLRAHNRPGTRVLHYFGSLTALILLICAVALFDWRLLIAAVVVGYACAWLGHVVVERNRPATFGHPAWSLISDYRMLVLWFGGRLGAHLARSRGDDTNRSI